MSTTRKVERADRKVATRARRSESKPLTLIGKASELADQPPLYAICALVGLAGLLKGDAKLARAGARMLAAEWTATQLKSVVKHSIDRARPMSGKDGKVRQAKDGAKANNSFPSGHSAGAVAVSRALARTYDGAALPAYAVAATAAAVQVPRGKHYASDVVAGVIIGLVADACLAVVERAVSRRVRAAGSKVAGSPLASRQPATSSDMNSGGALHSTSDVDRIVGPSMSDKPRQAPPPS